MQAIDRQQVQQMKDERDDLAIVEVLSEDEYKKFHLPGAINVPVSDGFEQKIQQAVPEKDKPVIVYCQDKDCKASPKAAKKMESLGYTEVYDYEHGKEDWHDAGLPVIAGPQPG